MTRVWERLEERLRFFKCLLGWSDAGLLPQEWKVVLRTSFGDAL